MRRARAAVTFVFFAHGALFGTWAARIPAIKEHLGLSSPQLGLALLASTIGGLITLPLAGWIVSRAGSRSTVERVLPVFALLLPALALAPSLPVLALGLFGFGAAAGSVDIAMNAHGLAVERGHGRPVFSSLHGGWSLGGLAAAGVGSVVAHAGIDPLPHFAVAAALACGAGIVAGRYLLPGHVDRAEPGSRIRRPPRRLLVLAALAFCGLFGESAAYDWSAVYVAGPVRAGAGVAALAFAAFSLTMGIFRLAGDRLGARLGPVRLLRIGGVASTGGLALALLVPRPAYALAGFACMGAGLASFVPIAFRAAGSVPGLPPGVGIAALSTVGYGAFLAGPPAIGFTAGAVGLRGALWFVVGLQAVLLVLAPAAGPPRGAAPID